MNDDLRRLQDLTQILLDADLARLQQLADETRRRQDEVVKLGTALTARSNALKGTDEATDLAFQTGQDARWQAWTTREKKRLMRETAEIAAQREAQRKKAQKAFGRVEALAGIRRLQEEERKLHEARRLHADPERTGKPG